MSDSNDTSESIAAEWNGTRQDAQPDIRTEWDRRAYQRFRICQHKPHCQQFIEHWLCEEVQKVCPHDPKCRTFHQCKLRKLAELRPGARLEIVEAT